MDMDQTGKSAGTIEAPQVAPHLQRKWVFVCAFLLLAVNLVIVATLFGVEYSAYTGSIEGTFIAIPRIMAKFPGQWSWWPFWNGGLPFENVYLPFSHWMVAAFTLMTGLPAARSFHIVTAAVYAVGALSAFWMALALSRKLVPSFIAALTYSCVSFAALLIPAIAADAGGQLNLRRLHILVFWGESPHTMAVALLPLAIVCFHRVLTTDFPKWRILAGVLSALVVLSNAFGIVMLAVALVSLLLAERPNRHISQRAPDPWWKPPLTISAIGVVSYCWVSPWLSPSLMRAIRANAPTAGGDFRYTASSWIALVLLCSGGLLLWFVMRRAKAATHVQFFALFGYLTTGIVLIWYVWKVAVVPQPGRYQLEMDLVLPLAVVFCGAAILDRLPRPVRSAVVVVSLIALAVQTVYAARYARDLIRAVPPATLSEYKIAQWLGRNRPGQRAFISGSGAFLFNAFTDNPQLHGGHDQHTVNSFIPMVDFAVCSGMNAGNRDAEYSVFWLKAFGVRSVAVSGPGSTDHYKAIAHPQKFDGVLPLLWREGGDAIYDIPSRSPSLAHVIPASAVVTRRPIHGLDIAPVEPYIAALDDPQYPPATFVWKDMSEAEIHASLAPHQVISTQITYERGWRAYVNGKPQPLRGDAIGQMVLEPHCVGPCEISLRYTGGPERAVTRAMSLAAMLAAAVYAWLARRRKTSL
jgi:hypothetical protein